MFKSSGQFAGFLWKKVLKSCGFILTKTRKTILSKQIPTFSQNLPSFIPGLFSQVINRTHDLLININSTLSTYFIITTIFINKGEQK